MTAAGRVYVVGAGPGDPGLVTAAGLAALRQAGAVLYDHLVPAAILDHAPPAAERIATCGPGGDPLPPDRVAQMCAERARAGRTVVRLLAGDPLLFSPGDAEVAALTALGVPVTVVPGVSAATAAAAAAGIPLTPRGAALGVLVASGYEPVPPEWAAALVGGRLTAVFFLPRRRLAPLCQELLALGCPADLPCALVQAATRPDQRHLVAPLGQMAAAADAAGLGAPLALVVPGARPLAGRTVVITRAAGQGGSLAAAVAALGGRPWEFPVIAFADPVDWGPADAALARLHTFDWAVFTSQNGVDRLMQRLAHLGRDARAFGPCRVAAVGQATAAALRRWGIAADLVPGGGGGDGDAGEGRTGARLLLEVLAPHVGPGTRVLVARAAEPAVDVAAALRERGAEVADVVVYRTVPAATDPAPLRAALAEGRVDYVTFTSGSTVRHFLAALGDPALLQGVAVACIGPQTAAAARAAGLAVHVVAPAPSAGALVQALAAHAAGRGK